MRRALAVTLLSGAALATTGAAPPPEEQAMLDAFDRVLTAMAYAASGLCLFAIVWAGFVLMAEGAEERGGGRAKSAVVMAVVGLALVLLAKAVAALLRSGLVDFPTPSSPTEDYLAVLAGQRQWIATTNCAGCPGRPPDSFANSAVLAIVVVDPHADLVEGLLRHVPPEIADTVRLIDLADERGAPGVNLLDTRVFSDRDRTADSVVRVCRGLWDQWGPRMQ